MNDQTFFFLFAGLRLAEDQRSLLNKSRSSEWKSDEEGRGIGRDSVVAQKNQIKQPLLSRIKTNALN